MKDVARAAGVSRSTVSNVVRGATTVLPETRDRVLAAVAATDYRPHALARALRERTTGVVALIVTDAGNPFYASLGEGIEAEARNAGLLTIFANSRCDPADERVICDALISRRVDGVIVGDTSKGATFPSLLADNGIPVVLAGCGVSSDPRVGSVDSDDEQAMELVVSHLRALGHTAADYIGYPDDQSAGARRRSAARSAAAAAGLDLLEGASDDATALIVHNDLLALSVLDALERSGRRVPEDVSVVGFDDTTLAGHQRIDLTSVRCDGAVIGRTAAAQIRVAVAEGRLATERVLLECELVIRGTTAPPRPNLATAGAGRVPRRQHQNGARSR